MAAGFRLPARWPEAANPDAAERLVDHLRGSGDRGWREACRRPEVLALLRCLGGNGTHPGELARREAPFLLAIVRHGPERAAAGALKALRTLPATAGRDAVAAALREAKRRVALACTVADLGGLWPLERVCGTLSLLAEAALRCAVAHLLRAEAATGRIALPHGRDPERGSGYCVLAMGKLGAGELNYSSDIDLVVLYDPEVQPDAGPGLVRMTGALVGLMEARDANGYVFRMDLRLRPDPGATPIAVSLLAAITYYESYGRTWERAAMIKARPVAGDLQLGERFLAAIRPFVWRRQLDFAAIADMRDMKRRIDRKGATRGQVALPGRVRRDTSGAVTALLGLDLKLGRGGIREIEFVAQALQLAWAGRAPALREPATLAALDALAAAGALSPGGARTLERAYRRLRELEHRLQMLDDRQTHALPDTIDGFDRFARFAGESDPDRLAREVLALTRRVRRRFEHMLRDGSGGEDRHEVTPAAPAMEPGPNLPTDPALGDPATVRAMLDRWDQNRYRALREDRARVLLAKLTPAILRAMAAQRDPAAALARFDALLARQSAGVSLLALLQRHPELLERIGLVLGAAPALADQLVAGPGALDGLLLPEPDPHRAGPVVRAMLDERMRLAPDSETAMRDARALVRGEEFRIGLATLDGQLDIDAAGEARTALAEAVVRQVLRLATAEHRNRHGSVRGGAMGVVLLGKGGSRGMMAGSDLDLMLVYDHPDGETESRGNGKRLLPASQYFNRLAHAVVAMLSTPGLEGPLYPLDMRLRPSGSKGPVAVSLAAFERYHATESWTWERMALCRARMVAGTPALKRRVTAAIAAALDTAPDAAVLRSDAAAMRRRLERDLPASGPWDVKLRPGGLMEVEFIAQVSQLAARNPLARHPDTATALRRLMRAGLLDRRDGERLVAADRFWRRLQGALRLLLGVSVPRTLADLPPAVRDALLGMVLPPDTPLAGTAPDGLAALLERCDTVAAEVRNAFERLVGPVATTERSEP